jgi:hypothetical protein
MKTFVKITKVLVALVWLLFYLVMQLYKYLLLMTPVVLILLIDFVFKSLPPQWTNGECGEFLTLGVYIFSLIVGGLGGLAIIFIPLVVSEVATEPILKWVKEGWDEEKK